MNRMIKCSVLLISMMGSGLFGAAPKGLQRLDDYLSSRGYEGTQKKLLAEAWLEKEHPDVSFDFLPSISPQDREMIRNYYRAMSQNEALEKEFKRLAELAEEAGVAVPQRPAADVKLCELHPEFQYGKATEEFNKLNLALGAEVRALDVQRRSGMAKIYKKRQDDRVDEYRRLQSKAVADMEKEHERKQRWQLLGRAVIVTAAIVANSPEGRQLISSLLIRGLLYA